MASGLRLVLAGALIFGATQPSGHTETSVSLNEEGVKAFNSGDLDSAVFYFSEALKRDGESHVIRRNLSSAYERQAGQVFAAGDADKAVRLLERAVDVDPDNASPLIQLGYLFLNLEENYNAILRLEEAIELDPESPEAHFLLGEAYYRDNDLPAAQDQWEWVFEVKPGLPGLRERLETIRRETAVEGDFDWKQSRRFNVTYNPDLRGPEVADIIRILDAAYLDIGRRMDGTYPPGPIQVTLYAAEEFSQSTLMGKHVGAVFDGNRIRCPVIQENGQLLPRDQLREVLYHEYTHVVVKYIAARNVPWWLNEGLAESLSRPVTELDSRILQHARAADALFPLAELESHQLERLSPEMLALAYSQSHVIVDYLIQRYGMLNVVAVLKRLNNGESPEDAFRKVFRVSYETLDLALEGIIDEL